MAWFMKELQLAIPKWPVFKAGKMYFLSIFISEIEKLKIRRGKDYNAFKTCPTIWIQVC